jgi:hypothetical protein
MDAGSSRPPSERGGVYTIVSDRHTSDVILCAPAL